MPVRNHKAPTMSDNSIELNAANPEADAVDYAARKRRIVWMLLIYSAGVGAISLFLPEEDRQTDFLLGLPYLIFGVSWCFADARERNHRIGKLMQLVLVLFFVIGFPIYLFQTRGLRGFQTLAAALLLVIVMIACQIVAGYATYFAGDALGLFGQEDEFEFYEEFDE